MLPPIKFFDYLLHWFPLMVVISLALVSYFCLHYKGRQANEIATSRDRQIYLPIFICTFAIGLWGMSILESNVAAWALQLDSPSSTPINSGHQYLGNRFFGSMIVSFSVCILFYLFVPKEKGNRILDFLGLALCLGVAVGRLGCFFDGHTGCSGISTDLPWGIIIPLQNGEITNAVQPVPIYDSLFYGLLFVWLLWLDNVKQITIGKVGLLYFLIAACYNILMWTLRPDPAILGPFAFGQLIYIILLIMSLVLWKVLFGHIKGHKW